MLVPLFLESHAFLIQQDRLQDAERFRRARLLAAKCPERAAGASPLCALARRLTRLAYADPGHDRRQGTHPA
jgi:hypothetical protein